MIFIDQTNLVIAAANYSKSILPSLLTSVLARISFISSRTLSEEIWPCWLRIWNSYCFSIKPLPSLSSIEKTFLKFYLEDITWSVKVLAIN